MTEYAAPPDWNDTVIEIEPHGPLHPGVQRVRLGGVDGGPVTYFLQPDPAELAKLTAAIYGAEPPSVDEWVINSVPVPHVDGSTTWTSDPDKLQSMGLWYLAVAGYLGARARAEHAQQEDTRAAIVDRYAKRLAAAYAGGYNDEWSGAQVGEWERQSSAFKEGMRKLAQLAIDEESRRRDDDSVPGDEPLAEWEREVLRSSVEPTNGAQS